MSARDELAADLAYHIIGAGYKPVLVSVGDAHRIADAILAAGYTKPRTIATVEELDALAVGAVVRTAGDEDKFDPRVAIKTATLGPHSYWAVAGDEDGFESMSDELDDLPATVLYEPAP